MSLQPYPNLHRAVLHTTCDVVGQYATEQLRLDIAFPQMGDENDDIFSRHGTFYASFEMDNAGRLGNLLTRGSSHWMGRTIANLLSLRYGKSVEFMGFVYSNGHFMQPRAVHYAAPSIAGNLHPFVSNKPRIDYPPHAREDPDPFNLSAAELVTWVVESPDLPGSDALDTVLGCLHFYAEALRTFRDHPDYAYLSLVTAGEVFTGAIKFDDYAILDQDGKRFIDLVRDKLGASEARFAMKRLYASTNRFVEALAGTLDDAFFERTEALHPNLKMSRIQKETIRKALRSSYAIRSNLSHAGKRPIPWIRPDQLSEMPIGMPVIPGDPKWAKALGECLTHLGLERVIRSALLKTLLGLRPGEASGTPEPQSSPPPAKPSQTEERRAGPGPQGER